MAEQELAFPGDRGPLRLKQVVKNSGKTKSTTYVGSDGRQYTLSGDLSKRANNPGNISPVSAKARKYYEQNFNVIGYLHSSNGPDVAVFATPEDGARAQAHLWSSPKYQSKTLAEAAKSWAASPYVEQLAQAAGASKDTLVADLSSAQMQAIVQTQNSIEGKGQVRVQDASGRELDPGQLGFTNSGHLPAGAGMPASDVMEAFNPLPAPAPLTPASMAIEQVAGKGTGLPAAAPAVTQPSSVRSLVTLPSGKHIAPGTYPSSNPNHVVVISDDGTGHAVISHPKNPGEIPGLVDPLHEGDTVAGGFTRNLLKDVNTGQALRAAGLDKVAENALGVPGQALATVKNAVGTGALAFGEGALNTLQGLFGGASTPVPKTESLVRPSSGNDLVPPHVDLVPSHVQANVYPGLVDLGFGQDNGLAPSIKVSGVRVPGVEPKATVPVPPAVVYKTINVLNPNWHEPALPPTHGAQDVNSAGQLISRSAADAIRDTSGAVQKPIKGKASVVVPPPVVPKYITKKVPVKVPVTVKPGLNVPSSHVTSSSQNSSPSIGTLASGKRVAVGTTTTTGAYTYQVMPDFSVKNLTTGRITAPPPK